MVVLHTNHGPITLELDARAHRKPSPTSWPTFAPGTTQHAVPSRHRRLHDSRRRLRSRFHPEARSRADCERGHQWTEERALHRGDARTSDPHSATAQFFITAADNAFLDHRSPAPKMGLLRVRKVVAPPTSSTLLAGVPTGSRAGIRTYRRQTS